MHAKTIDRKCIDIDTITGLICIDGIIACKKVLRGGGKTYLQFKDGDRLRSNCRTCNLVEIPLDEFIVAVEEVQLVV